MEGRQQSRASARSKRKGCLAMCGLTRSIQQHPSLSLCMGGSEMRAPNLMPAQARLRKLVLFEHLVGWELYPPV